MDKLIFCICIERLFSSVFPDNNTNKSSKERYGLTEIAVILDDEQTDDDGWWTIEVHNL